MNHYTGAYINRAEFSRGELTVNSCGNYLITQEDFHTYREHGTHDFQMVYLHKGELVEHTCNKRYTDETVLFFLPETKHDYTYIAQKNTDVFWMHFGGTDVRDILKKYNIDPGTAYHLADSPNPLRGLFYEIIREITIKDAYFKESCIASFHHILIFLSRYTQMAGGTALPRSFQKVIETMYMEHAPFDMKTYAEMCCLSVSRFAHMFKQVTGSSPHALYMQIKANKAKDLILNSELNISEIAENLGFSDIYYFSRFYKKYFGVSPSKHRKT